MNIASYLEATARNLDEFVQGLAAAMNEGESPRRRQLIQALDEANDELKRYPMNDPRRSPVVLRIVQIEDALTAEGEL